MQGSSKGRVSPRRTPAAPGAGAGALVRQRADRVKRLAAIGGQTPADNGGDVALERVHPRSECAHKNSASSNRTDSRAFDLSELQQPRTPRDQQADGSWIGAMIDQVQRRNRIDEIAVALE